MSAENAVEDGVRVDAWLPPEMAERAEAVGVKKAELAFSTMLALAILAGAFIALGAAYATTASSSALPYSVNRLLAGLTFSLGLILVVVAGAELFTGNNLIAMAWASGKVTTAKLVRSWVIVYIGNLIGAMATAGLVFVSKQYSFGAGAVGKAALAIAQTKCGLPFVQAFALGILCNALVCMAVWLCFSARTTTDKILSIVFPISAFVACGFEHSVANMYFIPVGLLIRNFAAADFWSLIHDSPASYGAVTWMGFARNLAPVTLGNIFGGSVMVGLVYWFVYLRKAKISRT